MLQWSTSSASDTKTKRLGGLSSPRQERKTDGAENELKLVLGCREFEGQSSGTSSVGKLVHVLRESGQRSIASAPSARHSKSGRRSPTGDHFGHSGNLLAPGCAPCPPRAGKKVIAERWRCGAQRTPGSALECPHLWPFEAHPGPRSGTRPILSVALWPGLWRRSQR